MNIDTRNPVSNLNMDTELRLLRPTDYRYGKNGRSGNSDKEGDGSVELIRSNKFRADVGGFTQRGTVIGSCPDIKNNAVIYFNCRQIQLNYESAFGIGTPSPTVVEMVITGVNPPLEIGQRLEVKQGDSFFIGQITDIQVSGTFYTMNLLAGTVLIAPVTNIFISSINYIYRYYENTDTFEFLTNPIAMSNALNFQLYDRIINPRVIESSFGQLLTWTDGVNPPRLMNIDKMKDGGIYFNTATDAQYINLAKQPPQLAPTISFSTNPSSDVSLVKDRFFQFRYRYIYTDGQISTLSPISDIAIPANPTLLNNVINVTVLNGHPTVSKIEVIYREGNGVSADGTTNPNWYIFDTINRTNTVSQTVMFVGNESAIPISATDAIKNFDTVPITAQEIEVSDTNQIILGDIVEGYDSYDGGHSVELKYKQRGFIWYAIPFLGANGNVLNIQFGIGKPFPEIGDTFIIRTRTGVGTFVTTEFIVQSADVLNAISLAQKIVLELANNGVLAIRGGTTAYQNITLIDTSPEYVYVYSYPKDIVKPTIKTNNYYDVSIVYYDDYLRQGTLNYVQKNVYVPNLQVDGFPSFTDEEKYYLVRQGASTQQVNKPSQVANDILYDKPYFELTFGTAPSWATKFSIVLSEPYTDFIVKYVQVQATPYSIGGKEYNFRILNTGNGAINIDNTWVFSKETLISIVGDSKLDNKKNFRVTNWDANNEYFNVDLGNTTLVGITTRYIEFMHPSNNELNYEAYFGDIPSAGTKIQIDKYSSWYKYFSHNTLQFPENIHYYESPSGTANSENYYFPVRGRFQYFLERVRRYNLLNAFRWGGNLIDNTKTNNLSTWDEGNIAQVNAKFGAITGLRQIGYTLKIIQWGNINSAFIGRREVQNTDGSTQLVVTDNLVGTINPSEREFGTKYPGSIINTGLRLYYFDSLKNSWIVDDGNGVNEIALYSDPTGTLSPTMNTHWREVSNMINKDPNYDIITGFDFLYRDAWVSVVNVRANTQQTIYYNEFQNAWKYFVDLEHLSATGVKYIPECYGNVGQSFFSFIRGNLFQFNKGDNILGEATYGELYKLNDTDPLKPLIVETIGMIDPDKVKVFLTHEYHANLPISLVELFIPPNQMYPNGMYSVLKPANYKYREGVFYADIKRDAYTKGFTTDPVQLRNNIASGRPLRGHVCKVRLTFTTDKYLKLFSTGVGMIASEKS